jgi:hypothetical protein
MYSIVWVKMKLYFKLFLATGIPFAIFTGILNAFQFGLLSGLISGLITGILFGGFMSLILGFLQTWSVKQLPFAKSEEATGVHHVRNAELLLPYDVTFNTCIKSLSSIKKCRIQNKDRSQGKIIAKTSMTWKTYGDVISFQLSRIDDERTQVQVSSRPFVRTTLVDYGKNLENVETIFRIIKQNGDVGV